MMPIGRHAGPALEGRAPQDLRAMHEEKLNLLYQELASADWGIPRPPNVDAAGFLSGDLSADSERSVVAYLNRIAARARNRVGYELAERLDSLCAEYRASILAQRTSTSLCCPSGSSSIAESLVKLQRDLWYPGLDDLDATQAGIVREFVRNIVDPTKRPLLHRTFNDLSAEANDIRRARASSPVGQVGPTSLILHGMGITDVPSCADLFASSGLCDLNLANNRLSELTDNLKSLIRNMIDDPRARVNLSRNDFRAVPLFDHSTPFHGVLCLEGNPIEEAPTPVQLEGYRAGSVIIVDRDMPGLSALDGATLQGNRRVYVRPGALGVNGRLVARIEIRAVREPVAGTKTPRLCDIAKSYYQRAGREFSVEQAAFWGGKGLEGFSDGDKQSLADWLDRLSSTREGLVNPSGLTERVVTLLEAMAANKKLLEECIPAARDANAGCRDRTIMGMSWIAQKLNEHEIAKASLDKRVAMAQQNYRAARINEYAAQVCAEVIGRRVIEFRSEHHRDPVAMELGAIKDAVYKEAIEFELSLMVRLNKYWAAERQPVAAGEISGMHFTSLGEALKAMTDEQVVTMAQEIDRNEKGFIEYLSSNRAWRDSLVSDPDELVRGTVEDCRAKIALQVPDVNDDLWYEFLELLPQSNGEGADCVDALDRFVKELAQSAHKELQAYTRLCDMVVKEKLGRDAVINRVYDETKSQEDRVFEAVTRDLLKGRPRAGRPEDSVFSRLWA